MKIRTIHFVKRKQPALYVQVYEAIKAEILNGSMKKGDQLPSIRKAADMLSISKTSIESAYQRLLLEGFIVSIAQRGYFVDVDQESADLRKLILAQPQVKNTMEPIYDLRSSAIDADAFDRTLWMHYIKEVLYYEEDLMVYGDPQGEQILRTALQKYSYAMRGVMGADTQFVVGSSFQSLLYLICSLYDGKKVIGLEGTGFPQAEQVFRDCGFQIVHLPQDAEGVCVEKLAQYEIGILYVNSASCGTLHKSLRSNRRSALLAYIQAHDILLLEDDHNGELRYQTKIRPALQGFDREHVIYIRSFAKLLLPSLRISFMVLNETMSKRYLQKKQYYNPSASKIEQLALAHYLLDGQLEKQVRRLRKRYERKSEVMMALLKQYFPGARFAFDESNLQIYMDHIHNAHFDTLQKRASAYHIYLPQPHDKTLSLSFASIQEVDMEMILQQIAKLLS